MNKEIYKKFADTVKKYALLEDDGSVIAALSGGADSVCLLLLLNEYRVKKCGGKLRLTAVHYNHGIRGAEADSDQLFCVALCERIGVELITEKGNVPEYAKIKKMSLEEAARELRYKCLKRYADERGAVIAVAHNQNDRIETVLHNIARGTSIEGLKGIAYKRGGIIRPIMDITREETELVCREAGIDYRVDSTNADCVYTRNKIRNDVLPYLEKSFGGSFSKGLLRLSALAAEDNDFLRECTAEAYKSCAVENEDGSVVIDGGILASYHIAIGKRVVRTALSNVRREKHTVFGGGTGIDRSMTERIYEYILAGKGGGYAEASKGVICQKKGGLFYIEAASADGIGNPGQRTEYKADVFGEVLSSCGMLGEKISFYSGGVPYEVTAQLIEKEKLRRYLRECAGSGERCVLFDLDELKKLAVQETTLNKESKDAGCEGIVLRTGRTGDYFVPFGAAGGKPLRRFFTDVKTPLELRGALPLIACGDKILHIFYLRRSNFASVHKNTEYGIMIKISELQQ